MVSFVDEYTFGDLKSFKTQFGKSRDARPLSQADIDVMMANPGKTISSEGWKRRSKPPPPGLARNMPSSRNDSSLSANGPSAARSCSMSPIRTAMLWCRSSFPTMRNSVSTTWSPSTCSSPLFTRCLSSQRQLMTLILRKLLASSSHAISGTLAGVAAKLEAAEQDAITAELPAGLAENFELLPELQEEWGEDDDDGSDDTGALKQPVQLTPEQREERRQETAKLREFHTLATQIQRNSKATSSSRPEKGFPKQRVIYTLIRLVISTTGTPRSSPETRH